MSTKQLLIFLIIFVLVVNVSVMAALNYSKDIEIDEQDEERDWTVPMPGDFKKLVEGVMKDG